MPQPEILILLLDFLHQTRNHTAGRERNGQGVFQETGGHSRRDPGASAPSIGALGAPSMTEEDQDSPPETGTDTPAGDKTIISLGPDLHPSKDMTEMIKEADDFRGTDKAVAAPGTGDEIPLQGVKITGGKVTGGEMTGDRMTGETTGDRRTGDKEQGGSLGTGPRAEETSKMAADLHPQTTGRETILEAIALNVELKMDMAASTAQNILLQPIDIVTIVTNNLTKSFTTILTIV